MSSNFLQPKWKVNTPVGVPNQSGSTTSKSVEYGTLSQNNIDSIAGLGNTYLSLVSDEGVLEYPKAEHLTNMMMLYFNEVQTVMQQNNANNQLNANYLGLLGRDTGAVPTGNLAYQDMLQQAQVAGAMSLAGSAGSGALSASDFTITNYIKSGVKNYDRTSNGIWIQYPQSINFTSGAIWQELASEPNALGLLGTQSSEDGKLHGLSNMGSVLARESAMAAFNLTSKGGDQNGGLGSAITKSVKNTYNDMNFGNMERRKFQFTWSLIPRSKEELYSIDLIIRLMRFHAHPSYDELGAQGTFLTFPGHIDVEWYTNDGTNYVQNAWLPKIATCVITGVATNYSPNNQYAFLMNSGAPAQIDLTLTLAETQPLLKQDISRGF